MVGVAACFLLGQKGVFVSVDGVGLFLAVGDNGMIGCICLQDCRRLFVKEYHYGERWG